MKPHIEDKKWREDFEFKEQADERMTIASAMGETEGRIGRRRRFAVPG
jgi:hypothetical protein